MLHHSEIKAKVHVEIDQVCGAQDLPTLEMKEELPYTNAFIQESLRYAKLVPFALLHWINKDVAFDCYIIPKDTTILSAICMCFNTKHFKNPKIFNPERFISGTGEFKASDHVIPFGVGKHP